MSSEILEAVGTRTRNLIWGSATVGSAKMKLRLRYHDQHGVETTRIFNKSDADFIGGVTAVPYLFHPKTAQSCLQVDCFYQGDWQQYGSYDLIRGYIFPFLDLTSDGELARMICGKSSNRLQTIREGHACRVTREGVSRNFHGVTTGFIYGLSYYRHQIDPQVTIEVTSEE